MSTKANDVLIPIIRNYLRRHSYATRADLLQYLSNQNITISDRALRALVESMVMDGGECIASTDHGYSMIENEQQLHDAVEYLRKKARPIAVRANQLINNYQQVNKTQLNITF